MTSVGFLVNPVAGMGGPVGLHGTDGTLPDEARRRGASPRSAQRAQRALLALRAVAAHLEIVTVAGPMGGDLLSADPAARLLPITTPAAGTSAADTRRVVRALLDHGVALILFAGGDGTARDVLDATGPSGAVVVGVPAGVKMHSGVFATTPEGAGRLAGGFATDPGRYAPLPAEVVDRDEDGVPALFGILMVPGDSFSMPRSKSSAAGSGSTDAQELRALGRELAAQMQPGRLYLLGPGTSVAQVNRALNLPDSPLGVDAVLDGRLLATDASEAELLRLVGEHPQATVILGVVGGQGFLLGRGNQQLSPAVLAAVSAEHIEIIAARSKVAALDPPVLRIDLGDAQASAAISGYRRVRTGVARSTVLQVVA